MSHSHFSQLLSQRQFMRFWLARLTGVMANQMLMVAVAWHIYDISASDLDLGLVGLFQLVPALLMTLPAGHLADRLHRGRIFLHGSTGRCRVAVDARNSRRFRSGWFCRRRGHRYGAGGCDRVAVVSGPGAA